MKIQNYFCKGVCLKLLWRSFCGKIVKNTLSWTYVISDFSGEKIFGKFFKNDYKKEIQKSFGLKKQLKENEINYMLRGKTTIVFLIIGLIKEAKYRWVNIFRNQNLLEKE